MTIDEEAWHSANGKHIARIGPLPFIAGEKSSAQYMEAIFPPGMKGATHMHPGPEAWYTLSGETCLETPEGAQVGRAGGPPVIVRANLPMQPVATGHETRRAAVLILHEQLQATGVDGA